MSAPVFRGTPRHHRIVLFGGTSEYRWQTPVYATAAEARISGAGWMYWDSLDLVERPRAVFADLAFRSDLNDAEIAALAWPDDEHAVRKGRVASLRRGTWLSAEFITALAGAFDVDPEVFYAADGGAIK